jgi:hypothetical protein
MITSVTKFNPAIKTFDVSVFNGCYVTGTPISIWKFLLMALSDTMCD